MTDALDGLEETSFEFEGVSRRVFRRGSGPAVVVIHEVPGITPEVADFGRRVDEAAFTAVLPQLFGEPGKRDGFGDRSGGTVSADDWGLIEHPQRHFHPLRNV